MRRFHFRLDRVLEYMRQKEQVQSMKVATVEMSLVRAQTQREDTIAAQHQVAESIRTQHNDMTREELMQAYAHSDYLNRMITKISDEIAVINEQLDIERNVLIELSKRRQIVDELRSRRREKYDADLLMAEYAHIDEVNARQFSMSHSLEENQR